MRPHDFFGCFNALHLRHGDVHEHDVGIDAVIFGDCGYSVTGFAGDLPAEALDHAGKILAREDRVVNDEISHRLTVLAAFHWCKLLHKTTLPLSLHTQGQVGPAHEFLLSRSHGSPRTARISPGTIGCTLRLQRVRHGLQRNDAHCITTIDGRFWHSEYDAGVLALRDCHSAGRFHRAQ